MLFDEKFVAEYADADKSTKKQMMRSVLDKIDAEFMSLVNAGIDTDELWNMGVVETDKFIEQCKMRSQECKKECGKSDNYPDKPCLEKD